MTADDVFGPETNDERMDAEGHPLMEILDTDPMESWWKQTFGMLFVRDV